MGYAAYVQDVPLRLRFKGVLRHCPTLMGSVGILVEAATPALSLWRLVVLFAPTTGAEKSNPSPSLSAYEPPKKAYPDTHTHAASSNRRVARHEV